MISVMGTCRARRRARNRRVDEELSENRLSKCWQCRVRLPPCSTPASSFDLLPSFSSTVILDLLSFDPRINPEIPFPDAESSFFRPSSLPLLSLFSHLDKLVMPRQRTDSSTRRRWHGTGPQETSEETVSPPPSKWFYFKISILAIIACVPLFGAASVIVMLPCAPKRYGDSLDGTIESKWIGVGIV